MTDRTGVHTPATMDGPSHRESETLEESVQASRNSSDGELGQFCEPTKHQTSMDVFCKDK